MIQASSCADKDIRAVFENLAIRPPYLEVPLATRLVIATVLDFMLQSYKSIHRELVGGGFEICLNFLCGSIES